MRKKDCLKCVSLIIVSVASGVRLGNAVLCDQSLGLWVTCYHVVKNSSYVVLSVPGGFVRGQTVLWGDEEDHDLAIIRTRGTLGGIPQARLGRRPKKNSEVELHGHHYQFDGKEYSLIPFCYACRVLASTTRMIKFPLWSRLRMKQAVRGTLLRIGLGTPTAHDLMVDLDFIFFETAGQEIALGMSGSPIFQDGKVVGVVSRGTGKKAFAIPPDKVGWLLERARKDLLVEAGHR